VDDHSDENTEAEDVRPAGGDEQAPATEPAAPVPSPREFIHRRMAELAQEETATPDGGEGKGVD
jgi:hypothetical protein